MDKVEDAIRAWEADRAAEEGARRALDAAGTRETASRMEAVRLMGKKDSEGSYTRREGAVGWVVDGRFYYRIGDEVYSMGVANHTPKVGAR